MTLAIALISSGKGMTSPAFSLPASPGRRRRLTAHHLMIVLALAWIDWTDFLLPDVLTLPLVLAGLASTLTFDSNALTDHCLAAILAYLSFRGLAAAYRRLRGRDGLGGGDAKLIAGAAWPRYRWWCWAARCWGCSQPWDWR